MADRTSLVYGVLEKCISWARPGKPPHLVVILSVAKNHSGI